MNKTSIEWCDMVWNPVTGCTKVSEGCRNCYAESIARRFWKDRKFTDVRCHPERLDQPLHVKKPSKIFVNSMSDLFHKDVPDEFIQKVMSIIDTISQIGVVHKYMILTKRADRMMEYFKKMIARRYVMYDNVWLGVSIEDQKTADERIPLLLQTHAAHRFVSVEPMLEEVDISPYLWGEDSRDTGRDIDPLDWVICGGETGQRARPIRKEWVVNLKDQCECAGVPFFFKKWGPKIIPYLSENDQLNNTIDGVEYRQFPEELK